MAGVEPNIVRAIRMAVADRLGCDAGEIEIAERTVPGSSKDEPEYATIRIPRKDGLTEEAVNSAVIEVNGQWGKGSHPAYPVEFRWEWKDSGGG